MLSNERLWIHDEPERIARVEFLSVGPNHDQLIVRDAVLHERKSRFGPVVEFSCQLLIATLLVEECIAAADHGILELVLMRLVPERKEIIDLSQHHALLKCRIGLMLADHARQEILG